MINLNDHSDTDDVVLNPATPDQMATCWVTVGNVSLQLVRGAHSIAVNAYPLGLEMGDPLQSLEVWFSDAQYEIGHPDEGGTP